MFNPVITLEYVNWAKNIIIYSTNMLAEHFDTGELTSIERTLDTNEHITAVAKGMIKCIERTWENFNDSDKKLLKNEGLHSQMIISKGYITQNIGRSAIFGRNKIKSLNDALLALQSSDAITLIKIDGTKAESYQVNSSLKHYIK